METDLQDALIAWQGGELPPGRSDELISRLRDDPEFRRRFADDVWTLSLTRIAQAPDPRWLALNEELGLTPSAHDVIGDLASEDRLMAEIRREPVRFVDAWWRRVAYGAMAAAVTLALAALAIWGNRPTHTPGAVAQTLAVLLQADNAIWHGKAPAQFATGSSLSAGRLRLSSGRVSLMFTSGVTLNFEGPADLDLVTTDRVVCREGRLRMHVPPGAEGFSIETPGGAVTDLGTELGVSVAPDGNTRVAVFEGKAEASLRIPGQGGVRTELLEAAQSVELLPATGQIRTTDASGFLAPTEVRIPPLRLHSDYTRMIKEARPAHYWRLDHMDGGVIPNEIEDSPALHLVGGATLDHDPSGRSSVVFHGKEKPGALHVPEPWKLPGNAHAIELWFISTTAEQRSLAAFTSGPLQKDHLTLVELAGRLPGRSPRPGIVRYLTRWPAGPGGGINIFSPPDYLPYRWHHLVAQQSGGKMELFLNGKLVGTAQADAFPAEVTCNILFGCLRYVPTADKVSIERPFAGRIAEIAIYDRLLTEAEIRFHMSLRSEE